MPSIRNDHSTRIALIASSDYIAAPPGGITTYLRNLLVGASSGVEITLIGFEFETTPKRGSREHGGRTFRFVSLGAINSRSSVPVRVQACALALKKHEAIRQVAADVWYVHSPELCAVLPSGDAKIAFHLHGASTTAGYSSHKWLRNPIGSFAFRSIVETSIKKSDLVLGVNEDCRRLASAHGVSYVSAPPFVDARVFYAADGLHRPTGNFTIGYVGRIDDNKNVGFLVEVLACLLRRGLDARLLVGGDGPSAADLARQIQELGLSNHVTMLGWLPHESVPEVLRSIDFFVMASVVEGLPTALLEAMACGCVPVVPATNEFLQVVSPGENGLVYEGYNAEVVAKSVIDALPIRETLAENALSLIRREYTDAVVLPRVLESLKALTEL